ncbi:DUF2442 domain-containing protein [Burkholderia pyrrocinia]|uniref:DUF2442 domain-containing protein n=1 Tax=Burkholderia pyrrocinia TaxID=60550 RepID=UPI001BCE37E5|nr:DUF2442 domain-containing protein [Burkholderia pyrrocinia]QVN18731.1 DUF2442 domain-containing protein [Burkholderia pyrrocinia]
MTITEDDVRAAEERMEARLKDSPAATEAHFDGKNVIVKLSNGKEFNFNPAKVQGLERASARELKYIELSPFGDGLYFPELDVDLYVPALLKGIFGSKAWMKAHH